MKETLRLKINGQNHRVSAFPGTPLLYILRNQLGLSGPKYGCGIGQCGSCAIHMDGQIALSCTMTGAAAADREITTIEGLSSDGELHPLQEAFIDEQAAQCGYCTNGMIMSAAALLNEHTSPSDSQIREALHTNLCRCGSQSRVLRAIKSAIELNQKPD